MDVWREQFADALPEVEVQPRFEQPLEQVDLFGAPPISFEFLTGVQVPRLWFKDPDGTQLVQLQNNWFARNWRKLETSADYPLYPSQREAFEWDLRQLAASLETRDLGTIVPTQCEITYVNHIVNEEIARVMVTINDLREFGLPEAEGTNYITELVITADGKRVGRLHIQAMSGRSTSSGEPLVALTLTARAKPLEESVEGVLSMLDISREWCDRAFESITRPGMHEKWGKR